MEKQMDIPAAEQIVRLLAQVESLSRDNEWLAADNARIARDAVKMADDFIIDIEPSAFSDDDK